MGSAISYEGHRIDETAQILLRVLRDTGRRATAGELREEAGLDETNPVHYRVEHHLGPAGLVERAGRRERPGGAQDEVIYKLTEDGAAFVDTHESDLTDAIAASEAVETLRRIRATVDSYDERVSTVEHMIRNWRQWKNRWSTRVGRLQDTVAELEEESEEQSFQVAEINRKYGPIQDQIQEFDTRLYELERDVSSLENRADDLAARVDERPKTEEVDEDLAALYQNLAAEIEDIREEAEGLF
jgi:chromosome segregation ATPase